MAKSLGRVFKVLLAFSRAPEKGFTITFRILPNIFLDFLPDCSVGARSVEVTTETEHVDTTNALQKSSNDAGVVAEV